MLIKRSSLVFGMVLAGLVSGQISAAQECPANKKCLTKLAGATVAGAASYAVMYELVPWLFNSVKYNNNFEWFVCKALQAGMAVGMTLAGAELAWWLTPEGKLESSKKTIEKYGSLLERCISAGDDVFDVLEAEFVGNDMPLLVAFDKVNSARSSLATAQNGLAKLLKNPMHATEAGQLLAQVNVLRNAAERVLVVIARHPKYAEYKVIEEMRLARHQPKVVYHYN
jgi:hypothetical protein